MNDRAVNTASKERARTVQKKPVVFQNEQRANSGKSREL
jgi:hypothetical protein